MIAACRTRLADKITDLSADRIMGAAEFAEAVERATLPQAAFFAYLIPTGLRGGKPSSMSGMFTQPLSVTLGVVLGFRTHSPDAEAALTEIDARITQTIAAFVGWAPADQPGAFKLNSGRMTGFQKGAVFYQLEFEIDDQLRIIP